MSLSKSNYWYSNNCLHILKCVVPLTTILNNIKNYININNVQWARCWLYKPDSPLSSYNQTLRTYFVPRLLLHNIWSNDATKVTEPHNIWGSYISSVSVDQMPLRRLIVAALCWHCCYGETSMTTCSAT